MQDNAFSESLHGSGLSLRERTHSCFCIFTSLLLTDGTRKLDETIIILETVIKSRQSSLHEGTAIKDIKSTRK